MNTLGIVALTSALTILFFVVIALCAITGYLLKKQWQRNETIKAIEYTSLGAIMASYIGLCIAIATADKAKEEQIKKIHKHFHKSLISLLIKQTRTLVLEINKPNIM